MLFEHQSKSRKYFPFARPISFFIFVLFLIFSPVTFQLTFLLGEALEQEWKFPTDYEGEDMQTVLIIFSFLFLFIAIAFFFLVK